VAKEVKEVGAQEEKLQLEVDIESLTVGDLIALEEASKTREVVEWCIAHTNVTEERLRALPVSQFLPLSRQLAAQIKEALNAPN
jgi:hypothetical protein